MENLIWEDDILSYDIALSKVDDFAINMLKETSKDTNIAEIHYSKNKNKFIFSFEDYTPLSSVIENTIGTKEVLNILIQICDCINYSKISMLFENNLIFNIDYIFIDTNTNQLKMLYIPVQEKIDSINIKNFFKELMFDFDVEDYLTIKDIFKRISSKDFNINSFYDYLVEKLHKLNNATVSNLPPVIEETPIVEEVPMETEDFKEDIPIEEEDIPMEEVSEFEDDDIQPNLESEEETIEPSVGEDEEEDQEVEIEQEEIQEEDNTNAPQDDDDISEDDNDDTIFFNQTFEEVSTEDEEEESTEPESNDGFHIYDDDVPNEHSSNEYETSNDDTPLSDEDDDEEEDEDDDASSIFEGFSLDDEEEDEEKSSPFEDTSIGSKEDVSVPSVQHTNEPKVKTPPTDTYSNSNKSNEEFSFEDMLKYSNNITDLSSDNTNNDYIEHSNNKNTSSDNNMVATLTRCKDNYSKVIDKKYFIIGKSENTDFKIEDNITVSRSHATIIHKSDGYYINDNGSKNGTWVNDIKIGLLDNFKLQDNDRIVLSSEDELLIFHLTKKED